MEFSTLFTFTPLPPQKKIKKNNHTIIQFTLALSEWKEWKWKKIIRGIKYSELKDILKPFLHFFPCLYACWGHHILVFSQKSVRFYVKPDVFIEFSMPLVKNACWTSDCTTTKTNLSSRKLFLINEHIVFRLTSFTVRVRAKKIRCCRNY